MSLKFQFKAHVICLQLQYFDTKLDSIGYYVCAKKKNAATFLIKFTSCLWMFM